jgi:hypothetical protein
MPTAKSKRSGILQAILDEGQTSLPESTYI